MLTQKVGTSAPVYLTVVLEYLAAKVLHIFKYFAVSKCVVSLP